MRVELHYFEGCPNWKVALERLNEALRAVGRADLIVQRRLVETADEAEELKFVGSPTIRIEGEDPFADGDAGVGLACRVYRTPTGLSASPTTAQLVQALS
jgi:hypothetical protein